jgi:hypothetical protein
MYGHLLLGMIPIRGFDHEIPQKFVLQAPLTGYALVTQRKRRCEVMVGWKQTGGEGSGSNVLGPVGWSESS